MACSGVVTSVLRTTVLIWADILAVYAMWIMMAYLTDVWKMNFTHAAAVVNVFSGLVYILPIPMQFLIDTVMGNYWMLTISTLAYSCGLGFLTMSTPQVLADATGTCREYRPECIGDGQKILFYTAMPLVAIGMSGHLTALGAFAAEQVEPLVAVGMSGHLTALYGFAAEQVESGSESEMEEEKETSGASGSRRAFFCLGSFAVILVPLAAAIALPYIKPWSIRFGIPAIFTVLATFIFLTGSCSYNYVRPQGSALTSVVRVFVAAASKLFDHRPKDADKLYEIQDPDIYVLPHTRGLGCLDKAAIILPNRPLEQQEANRWKLCRVTEVEETKIIIRMIPIWLTFIVIGVVSSIGNTYFVAQANHLNRKVGRWEVPLPTLLWFYDHGKSQFAGLYFKIAPALGRSGARKYAPLIGIAISMVFATLCCITAAKVETRRLDVIKTHGLLDKPDEQVPMSIFWLLPQYALLGGLDGISENSIGSFFINQTPKSMIQYLIHFTIGVIGVGTIGSVLSVYVVGKIKPNWFQDTLNKSRLDNYYWILAALSAINLVVFILVANCYSYRDSESEDGEPPEYDETDEPYDGSTAQCCCC